MKRSFESRYVLPKKSDEAGFATRNLETEAEAPTPASQSSGPAAYRTPDDFDQRIADLRKRRENADYAGTGLTLHVDPRRIPAGMHAHWLNDDRGPQNFQEQTTAGTYTPLLDPEISADDRNAGRHGGRIYRYVGTHENGEPKYAYLCVKPEEWYKEDTLRQNATHRDLTAQIHRKGHVLAKDAAAEVRQMYTPNEGRLPPSERELE